MLWELVKRRTEIKVCPRVAVGQPSRPPAGSVVDNWVSSSCPQAPEGNSAGAGGHRQEQESRKLQAGAPGKEHGLSQSGLVSQEWCTQTDNVVITLVFSIFLIFRKTLTVFSPIKSYRDIYR